MIDDKHFRIELELTGITRKTAALAMVAHFDGYSINPLLGTHQEYSVTDHRNRDWYLLQAQDAASALLPQEKQGTVWEEFYMLISSPALDPETDLIPLYTLMGILQDRGAVMKECCLIRVRGQGVSQDFIDGVIQKVKDILR